MSLREAAPMTEEEARLLNPLRLAHLGDTVWDLMVRTRLITMGKNVHHMHQGAIAFVNAKAQKEALGLIADELTADEADLVRRARNTNAHHAAPKNQDPADYTAATALQALMGYLYLTGQDERIRTLFSHCWKEAEHA